MLPSVSSPEIGTKASARSLTDRLNAEWHKPALIALLLIVLAHGCVLLVRAIDAYAMGRPAAEAGSLLGVALSGTVPWGIVHYAYAVFALVALWTLRSAFVGRARIWWLAAFWIQALVQLEYALLAYQTIAGRNLFGAPQPICFIQLLGFLEGTAESGFNGLLTGPPEHAFSFLLLFVRRLELDLLYGALATIPMVVAVYCHWFPLPGEAARMGCTCAVKRARIAGERETATIEQSTR
jgi:hypothetical protein